MNPQRFLIPATALVLAGALRAQSSASLNWTNFIWQVQTVSGAKWQVPVAQAGQQLSPLPIDPGGARFELWTIKNSDLSDYLLDQKYVGTYVPQAHVTIFSEDPYVTRVRTRADRPFSVRIALDGLLSDPSAPPAARMVKLTHHVQSYGTGDGLGVNPDDATLLTESYLSVNGTVNLNYTVNAVPGADRSKVRGEERFTINSLPDYQAPESQIAAGEIQIWPVADGSIAGVEQGDDLRFSTPTVTLEAHDLYPDSRTYAQLYPGNAVLGTVGNVIEGSVIIIKGAVPVDRTLTLKDWDRVIDESGVWTMEFLTQTPFGIDRLDYVTFNINRNIKVIGGVNTMETN
jgi:hypothetical protein